MRQHRLITEGMDMKYCTKLAILVILAVMVFQSLASAAEPPSVQLYDIHIGSRLFLKTKIHPTPLVATLVSLNKDSLVLVNDYGAKYQIHKRLVSDAYISHGKIKKSDRAVELFLGWGSVGAALGFVLGYYLASEGELRGLDSVKATAIRWGGISGIGFGICGAVVGASSNEEIWKSVPIISVSVPIE